MSNFKFLVLQGGRSGEKPRKHMILPRERPGAIGAVRNGIIGGVIVYAIILIAAGVVSWALS